MDDEAPAPEAVADPKLDLATAIYAAWRNTYLNNIPVDQFARLEAAAPHLIAEIAKHL